MKLLLMVLRLKLLYYSRTRNLKRATTEMKSTKQREYFVFGVFIRVESEEYSKFPCASRDLRVNIIRAEISLQHLRLTKDKGKIYQIVTTQL